MRSTIVATVLVAAVLGGWSVGRPASAAGSGSKAAVKATILTWLLEGPCDVMTDEFLENQVFLGDTRKENCKLFRNLFQEKLYSAEDVKFSKVKVTGSDATAVVGDDFSNIESTYTLVKQRGKWRIASAELT